MSEEDLAKWWRKVGAIKLNAVMVNWVGMNTGYVPLSNLMSEFCTLSPKDEERLIPYLTRDGAAVRVTENKRGERMVYIWVK